MLAEGGQLAVQMPANFDHPSHFVAEEVANEFAEALHGYRPQVPALAVRYPERLFERLPENVPFSTPSSES